jgi:hypothetical protein
VGDATIVCNEEYGPYFDKRINKEEMGQWDSGASGSSARRHCRCPEAK